MEISVPEGADGFDVPVVNAARAPSRVRVRLVVPPALGDVLEKRSSGLKRLGPRQISEIRFPLEDHDVAGKSYDAIAVVESRNGRVLDRMRLRVSFAATAKEAPPAAAVASLNVLLHREGPRDRVLETVCTKADPDACLPMTRPESGTKLDTTGLAANVPLGVLSGEDDGHLLVHWTGDTVTIPSSAEDTVGLELVFSGTTDPGKYTGPLDLYPDDPDNETVSVTVTVTDSWIWAALALGAGVILAVMLRRFLGLALKVDQLKEAAKAADRAFDCGKKRDAGGDSFGNYSIAVERRGKADDLQRQLKELRALVALELSDDDPAYKAAIANVEVLEAHASAWCSFREEVAALKLALAAEPSSKAKPVGIDADGRLVPDGPERPRWWEDAQRLGNPTSKIELDFEALDQTRARVKKATALAKSWEPLTHQLWLLDARIALIEQLPDGQLGEAESKALTEAKLTVSEARWELWTAQDADDLERRGSRLDLAEAERNVARLSDHLRVLQPAPTLPPLRFMIGGSVVLEFTRRALAWIAGMPDVASLPAAEEPVAVAWQDAKRRVVNAFVLWGLVAALVYTGLNELYLDDEVFGTWPDYLQALAWGLGATVTIDYLSSTLDKFRKPAGSSAAPSS